MYMYLINSFYRLNLVLVDTAKGIKEVNDFFGIMGMAYHFFSASTLRHQKLIEAQKERGFKVLEIPHLSDT